MTSKNQDNPMRAIKIEKLVLNISAGESGDKLMKAQKVLKDLTGQDPVASKARITIRTFGIKRNEKIACHVTVRGEKADEILRKGLAVKDYELRRRNFAASGMPTTTPPLTSSHRQLRIRYRGAHRSGYQVRSLHWYLRHGLLRCPGQTRQASLQEKAQTLKDGITPEGN